MIGNQDEVSATTPMKRGLQGRLFISWENIEKRPSKSYVGLTFSVIKEINDFLKK